MRNPLFRKIDAYLIRSDDLAAAVAFYGERLGHEVIWRTPDAVAFRLPESRVGYERAPGSDAPVASSPVVEVGGFPRPLSPQQAPSLVRRSYTNHPPGLTPVARDQGPDRRLRSPGYSSQRHRTAGTTSTGLLAWASTASTQASLVVRGSRPNRHWTARRRRAGAGR